MRLHLGPIPDDFSPVAGWQPIREPGPAVMQLVSLPLGVGAMIAVLAGWRSILGSFSVRFEGGIAALAGFTGLLLSLPLLIAVHELVHALITPHFGLSPKTVLGCWPRRLLFYAHYCGSLRRGRFLAVLMMPFLTITILPLILGIVGLIPTGFTGFLIAWCSTWNALFSCGDLFGLALVAVQVPRGVFVRNQGWRTFWRRHPQTLAEPGAPPSGGPASPIDNSGAAEGPPSVS